MNFYKRSRIIVLSIALLLGYINESIACSFSAVQSSGCVGFTLILTDNTPGAGCTATWTVTLPNGTLLHSYSNCTASFPMTVPGVVQVTMTDTVAGVPCSATNSYTVYPLPTINGTFSTTETCEGACVYWHDSSSPGGANCSPLKYIINWGQSPFDTLPGLCRRYTQNGVYSPTILITNSCGCTADTTFINAITVTPAPASNFSGTPLTSCTSPLVSTMTVATPSPNAKYYWYVTPTGTPFGSTPIQANGSPTFIHAYPAGTYDVKLVAVDSLSGCADSSVNSSYVSAGVFAAACFIGDDSTGCYRAVNFTPCGNNIAGATYHWTFSGGAIAPIPSTINATTNATQNVAYVGPGDYTASLTVTYPGGCTSTLTKLHYPHFGDIVHLDMTSADTLTCTIPEQVCVTYTGTPCSSCTFSWAPTPNTTPSSHTGTCYQVTQYGQITTLLTVRDTLGCTSALIKNNYLTIEPIHACATQHFLNGHGCANDTVIVTNCSSGGPFSHVIWDFPGATIISQNDVQAVVSYPTSGCNIFKLSIQSPSGCVDSLLQRLCIGAKPNINVNVNPRDVCYGDKNLFTVDYSLSSSIDTTTSVTVWPEGISHHITFTIPQRSDSFFYSYPDFGKYAFCFLANNMGCNGDTICTTDSVWIFAPKPGLSMHPVCTNTDSVLFINNALGADTSFWTFNGINYPNRNANSDSFIAIFPSCGIRYPIEITIIGKTDTATVRMPPFHISTDTVVCTLRTYDTVSRPCFGVDFKFSPTSGCYGNFFPEANILQTSPSALLPSSVLWSYEPHGTGPVFVAPPGGYSGDTVPRLPIYYATPDVFDACIQVRYFNGCVDTLCKPNYLDMSQPVASFGVSDSAGCVPFCVQFSNTSIFQFATQKHFYWSFGDTLGVVDSFSTNPNHCFATVGQFQVCLNIEDSNGCTSTYCKLIQANTIHADFTESDSITCTQNPSPLNPITYNNSSTGFVSTLQWLLPTSLGPIPSTQGNVTSITEQYTAEGYDSIGMVAIDQYGTCRDTVWKPIHVANPIADYALPNPNDTTYPCPPLLINPFINLSRNNICGYFWDFGDGLHTDTARDASALYIRPGTYCVKQVVTSCHGCVDSTSKYCITINGPHVSMSTHQIGGCPCLPVVFVISSWNADTLYVSSNGGTPNTQTLAVTPRGSSANPTLDTVSFVYCNVGDVNPTVLAIDHGNGCTVGYDNLIVPIPIDTPLVHFTMNHGACGSDSVYFTNLTRYVALFAHDSTYLWTFGDGSTSTVKNPSHLYPAPGDYTVQLTVVNNVGCTSSLTQHIHVAAKPVAIFTVDDSLGCVPLNIHFTDLSTTDDSTTIVSSYWSFGDNVSISTSVDTAHNYTTPSTYVATLFIKDGYGCTDSAKHTILVQPPPSVTVGAPFTICLGDTATLSGSGSSTLNWITHYNISDTLSATPRVWPRVDTFYVLQVGVVARCLVYDTQYVNVSTIAILSDTATNLCLGQVSSFTASAQTTHATISNYAWAFGDGASAAGQSVSHKYNHFGTFSDTVIVVNSIGCKDTAIRPVVIADIPHAALSISQDSVCLGASVIMTNLSTPGTSASLSTFYFDIQPDGTPDYTTSPVTVTYQTAGTHNVLLVQKDNNQCVDSARKVVTIHALPHANFNSDTTCINAPNTYASSTILGDGGISFYNWSINGVSQGINANSINHTFPDSGTNVICLNVKDIYGCVDTNCKNVVILSSPQDTVSPLDTTICAGYSASFHVFGPRFDRVQWVPSTWVDNPTSTSVTITPRQTIRYQVYSYFLQCTPKIDTVNIYVIDSVPVSATADPENIVLGLSSNVTSVVKGTIDSIVWDPDSTLNCRNCRNPIATPSQTTTYNATVYYSKNGVVCSNRTSVTITVYKSCDNSLIYVPNTFTPNTDGHNDVFRLRGLGIARVNYFRVYDRWGKQVYEANNVDDTNNAAWNGGMNNDTGNPENSGVYVYVFEIQCITGQTVSGKGNVTLIR